MSDAPSARRPPWLARADRVGRILEDATITVLMLSLIILGCAQIVMRNVFSTGVAWADGLGRLGVLWLALLGAVAASRDHRHLAVDVLTRYLSPGVRRISGIATSVFTAGVTGALAWYSWAFVRDSRIYGDVLLDNWPAWTFQLILPVGFALISYRYILRATQLWLSR
jgi:TRAP-type C4-dicarboxylate transport system permease small subunit